MAARAGAVSTGWVRVCDRVTIEKSAYLTFTVTVRASQPAVAKVDGHRLGHPHGVGVDRGPVEEVPWRRSPHGRSTWPPGRAPPGRGRAPGQRGQVGAVGPADPADEHVLGQRRQLADGARPPGRAGAWPWPGRRPTGPRPAGGGGRPAPRPARPRPPRGPAPSRPGWPGAWPPGTPAWRSAWSGRCPTEQSRRSSSCDPAGGSAGRWPRAGRAGGASRRRPRRPRPGRWARPGGWSSAGSRGTARSSRCSAE